MTENEFNGKIAENLAFYRRLNGLTQAELADCLSYSDKSVSKWERGNGIPGVLSELIGQTGRCRETADKIKAAEKDRRAIEKAKKKAIERAKKQKRKK